MDGGELLLADLILAVHGAIALFITLGLPVIWAGAAAGWRFVHNPWFRYIHAGLMGVVLLETVAGVLCPLTLLEGALRRSAGQGGPGEGESFIGYWVGKLLFHDFTWTQYIVAYALFFGLVLLTFSWYRSDEGGKSCRPALLHKNQLAEIYELVQFVHRFCYHSSSLQGGTKMPAIEQIQGFQPRTDPARDRIQELKARAAEGLDDALGAVARNLGRDEAREAEQSLAGLDKELVAQSKAMHHLDPARVADLISDPFED